MSALYPDLAGRVALVTGGADGIGRATVMALARQGARCLVLDIDADKGERLVADVPGVVFRRADLRDVAATVAAIRDGEQATGPIALLVNNAGHDERHAFTEVTPDYWDDRLAVNLRHFMFVTQAVAPSLRAGRGAVVNLASTSWMQGAVNLIAYTTAKSAVIGFTRSLARELGPDGVRVNAVTPGWVMTGRQRAAATAERLARAAERQALPGEILPEDVAAMIVFLLSGEARMCTGQNFIVDAGVV
ncbi:NAD(P)-dependent dehydrogenase (short-subunit alcohol dehydrogenase family) [Chelatococcus caeni]|uniref:NAD(P)-dependent dehydrogenase (Short-subunit alcohol dehydrogenase family) n=1 Tax=Chelatococcus caeni TaxID=1348468 RepID=A0A840C3U6_9HYPH|nr:SDR family oxidoreductase [Chelatococcus caeni]MBB4018692.1 NAD(P)-dependent dehydrogenase (short-subunit alcohol dehydrogenase family) [Chelatococcus caeni]